MQRSVTYTYLQGGQERAYGDTVHAGYLEFTVPEGQMWASKMFHSDNPETRERVKAYARLFVANWSCECMADPWRHTSADAFFVNHLTELRMVEPGTWYVKVTYPYDD